MQVTFDSAKDTANQQKHGVSMALANAIDWSDLACYADTRKNYGERREIAYALIDSRLYCVVFTERGETIRIISLRKANKREVQRYVEQA